MRKFATLLLIAGVFVELFLEYFHKITAMTQDLGRHLLTGEIILQTHNVPKENLFSYTYPHFPFINHDWFSEVLFFLISSSFGFDALLLFSVLIVMAAFSVIFFYSIKKYGVLSASIVSLFYVPMLFERTDIRPEIFSFLFLAIFMIILYHFRSNSTKSIFSLIPLQFLWSNMHIYFIIGVAVIGLFFIDEIITQRKEIMLFVRRKQVPPQHTSILFVVLILCTFVTAINPNGIKGALFPFQVFQNYGYPVEENQNIFFLQQILPSASIVYFEIAVIILFLCLTLSLKKTRPLDWLLAIFFAALGISAVRNFSLFIFATFISFVCSLSLVLSNIRQIKIAKINKAIVSIFVYAVIFIALIAQIMVTIQKNEFGFGMVSGASKALDFFIANNLKGPIFNNFDIGSYIEYRLYPKEKVFVDGRPEAYPTDFFQQIYIPMQQDSDIFTLVDNRFNFNTIIFSYTDQTPWAKHFLPLIVRNEKWKVVYLDDFIIILAKNTKDNQQIIRQFGMDQDHVHISNLQGKNTQSLLRLAYFFRLVGWIRQEEDICNLLLQNGQDYCFALHNISKFGFKDIP